MNTMISHCCTIGDRVLTIETNKLAMQADGAITIRYGDTLVLVTACISDEPREGVDFVRLTVDYEEKLYAAGKIPGSFIRREGRPGEQATLTSRLTDRSLRPFLSKDLHNDIQVVITVLSADQENDPNILAVIGASTALTLSSIPFKGPVSAVSVGYIGDKLVLNPTMTQMNTSSLDLVITSTREAVAMVEAGAQEISEELLIDAIKFGHEANQEIIKLQESLQQSYGRPKLEVKANEINPDLVDAVLSELGDKVTQAINYPNRDEREKAIKAVTQEVIEKLGATFPEQDVISVIEKQLKIATRKSILDKKQHMDGRQPKEIRNISCEVGLLPRTHGSGLFSRGQTQVLAITTLGSLSQGQLIDSIGIEDSKRFMHHYNFPPFSTGEVKRLGSPGRREIGHGALAERAIAPVLPKEEDFAYTIRIVSEVLSSNGSSSMASVCSSSLSLMDAGVPIKAPVVGIAMGLVTGENNSYVVLTDIEGLEDAYGDMDFKVAGTNQGLTAIQLDIKLQGISYDILAEAIKQAREAHSEILGKLSHVISSSRSELSPYAPRMYKLTIATNKIGSVIGPGGKTIRSIIDETKVSINIEDNGTVTIGSTSEEAAQKAIGIIEKLTREVEPGGIYEGKVTRTTNFGAFVEVLPGKEGLIHISELANYHVSKVEDIVKIGDEITVKVTEIDNLGRVNLSRRALLGDSSQVQDGRTSRPPQKQSRPHPFVQHRRSGDIRPPHGR